MLLTMILPRLVRRDLRAPAGDERAEGGSGTTMAGSSGESAAQSRPSGCAEDHSDRTFGGRDPFDVAAAALRSQFSCDEGPMIGVDVAHDGGTIYVHHPIAGTVRPLVMKGRSPGMTTLAAMRMLGFTDRCPFDHDGDGECTWHGSCAQHGPEVSDADAYLSDVSFHRGDPSTATEATAGVSLDDVQPNGAELVVAAVDALEALEQGVRGRSDVPRIVIDTVRERAFQTLDAMEAGCPTAPADTDDGTSLPQEEINAVFRAGMSDPLDLLGKTVLYETDGRGGKRYSLPAIVTCVQRSHPALPLLRGAEEAERVPVVDHNDGRAPVLAHGWPAGCALRNEDGYWIHGNPVPIPLDGTVHLKVFTPGPQGTYDEFSVPYASATLDVPRSWRHLPDDVPF